MWSWVIVRVGRRGFRALVCFFDDLENRIPGPATYEQVLSIGKEPVSKYTGPLSAKFSMGRRITEFDKAALKSLETPGAGSYRAPS